MRLMVPAEVSVARRLHLRAASQAILVAVVSIRAGHLVNEVSFWLLGRLEALAQRQRLHNEMLCKLADRDT